MAFSGIVITRSNSISPDPRVEKAAIALSREGYAVQVVGWDRSGSAPGIRTESFGKLTLIPVRANFGRGLKNLPALLGWQLSLLMWLITQRQTYTIVHACDFDTVLPGLIVKGLFGKTLVYDIFDFYSDHLRATPDWIKRVIRAVDLKVIAIVDAVILADESRIHQISGVSTFKVTVIYNTPTDTPPQLRGRKGEFRLAFVGLLQQERGLFELIEVVCGRHHRL